MNDIPARLNSALEARYRIERKLGEGGMATVYLAEDLKHDRKVALKVLKPELAAVVGAERFLAEIRTTANLQHPHILPLFDSGEADGFLYYVMPYVEGESLRARLDREKQLPVDDALRIAEAVAGALDYAHRHGVIHRDIKPANILLHDGQPVVADFGIALAVRTAGSHRLTETGLSLGTPHYMSPEQATGDQAPGPASDIYSLGCVLYETLVGEPPYTGSTAQAVLGRVLMGEPESLTSQRHAVPLHVDGVVARALEKLPADRFASAGEFARALRDEGFRYGVAHGHSAAGKRVGSWGGAGWGLAAALAVLCGWLALSVRGGPLPQVRRLSLAVPEGVVPSWSLAVTPDGEALVLPDQASGSLYIQRLDDRSRIPIPGSEGGRDPAVSPDGRTVAFVAPGGLRVAPLSGGAAVDLVETRGTAGSGAICCLGWGAEGHVYYSRGGTIHRIPASGGSPELILDWDGPGSPSYYLPLGSGEQAIVGLARNGPDSLAWVDWADGTWRAVAQGFRPVVFGDRYLVFATDQNSLHAAVIDPETGEFHEGPVDLGEPIGVLSRTPQQEAGFAISASGDLAYWDFATEETGTLVWIDRTGGEAGTLDTDVANNFESVEIAPGGDRVAFSDGYEIWVRELEGGTERRLTTYQGMNRRPVWAPGGEALSFISDRDGRRAAYSLRVEGIAAPELLLAHPDADVDEVAWSPDGSWLVYRTGTSPGFRDLYARRLHPDTGTIVVSAEPDVDETSPVLSPDGRWLAYVSNETGDPSVWVRPFPDVEAGRRQVSTGGGTEPAWSSTGDELFFRTEEGLVSVEITDPESFVTRRESRLFQDDAYERFGSTHRRYAVDGAGDRFLMVRRGPGARIGADLVLQPGFMARVKALLGG